MSIATPPAQTIEDGIRELLRKYVEDEKEKFIKESTAEFEKKLRQIVGNCAIQLSNYYSIQRIANELIIHVQVGER